MKTEIKRDYWWGFNLTEQELRRIVQLMTEHADKAQPDSQRQLTLSATLRDGTILQSSKIDEVFAVENAGAKRIQKLVIVVEPLDFDFEQNWRIKVSFENQAQYRSIFLDSKSIAFEVTGESRDWAFLTASDIEDRIRRTKTFPWEYFLNSGWMIIALPLLLIVSLVFVPEYFTKPEISTLLQQQYESGAIKDPIQAQIFVLKASEGFPPHRLMARSILFAIIPFAGLIGLRFLLPWFSNAYSFYWGDYVAIHDKLRARRNVFWVVIILGLLVSIVATAISKKIGL